jgi:hypothetical protein
MAPNHVITIDNDIEVKENMMGWGLFFHPDLARGTSLSFKMKDFSFFNYEIAMCFAHKNKCVALSLSK